MPYLELLLTALASWTLLRAWFESGWPFLLPLSKAPGLRQDASSAADTRPIDKSRDRGTGSIWRRLAGMVRKPLTCRTCLSYQLPFWFSWCQGGTLVQCLAVAGLVQILEELWPPLLAATQQADSPAS